MNRKLRRLTKRRNKRAAFRSRHWGLYEKHKAADHYVRMDWHLQKFRVDQRAVRKLDRLIDEQEALIDSLRIHWNGRTPVGGPGLREVVRYGLNRVPGCYVTSTNGGVHSVTSYHYRDQAVDIGADSLEEKARFQRVVLEHFGPATFAELFGPTNSEWVKDGRLYTAAEGDSLEDQHDDHVHLAVID